MVSLSRCSLFSLLFLLPLFSAVSTAYSIPDEDPECGRSVASASAPAAAGPASCALARSAQGDRKSFRAADGASIDAMLTALYSCISGPAGQERDWKRFRALFVPDARLEAVIWRGEGNLSLRVLTVDEYVRTAGEYLKTRGFFEKEIARKTDRFGSIAQVFSTYEAFDAAGSSVPLKRGINSVQLFHDGSRWWIVSVLWDDERPGVAIPEEYLSGIR